MSGNRNSYIDFVKGILIFLVIFGHSIQVMGYSLLGNNYLSNMFFKSIYMFHMPLFIALSGYFCYKSLNKHSVSDFLKKRLLYLIVPLFSWILITTVSISTFDSNIFNSFIKIVTSQYWFIWAIIFYSVLIGILHKLKLSNMFGLISSVILVVIIPFEDSNLPIIKNMYPFFIIGYTAASLNLDKTISLCRKLLPATIILAVICFNYWDEFTYSYVTPYSFDEIKKLLFKIISGCSVSIIFLFILYYIHQFLINTKTIGLISKIGTETLGIYLIQEFYFNVFQSWNLNILVGFKSILYVPFSIILLILIYLLIRIINKNNWLSFILLGQRHPKVL